MAKPLNERIVEAEQAAAMWLADSNHAEENGQPKTAERCLAKSQFWLDRANKLRGWN